MKIYILLLLLCCNTISSFVVVNNISPVSTKKTNISSKITQQQRHHDTLICRHAATTNAAAAATTTNTLLSSLTTNPLLASLFRSAGQVPLLQSMGLNMVLFTLLSFKLKSMLTTAGIIHAFVLGTGLWNTLGYKGWMTCVLYLFLGQAVTKVKFEQKEKAGISESRGGRRGPENVWGSALTALICAKLSTIVGGTSIITRIPSSMYRLAFVASLATKLADTFASEIGKAYGKTTFLITTFQRVPAGTEGAVSLEGTLASVVGGFLLSLYGYYGVGILTSWTAVAVSTVSAFLATVVESYIGATIQGQSKLFTNEVVNFINTLVGAILAIVIGGKVL
mmetsp:Transcript_17346/g.20021  ORF Transcript_17346/g.20021 Transcript_17346/m.20021 type:complete len:337 (+) Transcript_17346:167-1177(+)